MVTQTAGDEEKIGRRRVNLKVILGLSVEITAFIRARSPKLIALGLELSQGHMSPWLSTPQAQILY